MDTLRSTAPNVADDNDERMLFLGGRLYLQSKMSLADPFALVTEYSRLLTATSLLFTPNLKKVLMIGLGGGSLQKFFYKNVPHVDITTVEIEPRVAEAARAQFFLPPDDHRMHVVIDDATNFVASHPGEFDLIIGDGFDSHGHVPELTTAEFFADCQRALRPGGVMGINIDRLDPMMLAYLDRMHAAFKPQPFIQVDCVSNEPVLVLFAFTDEAWRLSPDVLRERATLLKTQYGLNGLNLIKRLLVVPEWRRPLIEYTSKPAD